MPLKIRVAFGICVAITTLAAAASRPAPADQPRLAQIYFWRAKPGKFDEYTKYVREVAEPIDEAARKRDAFLSVATYLSRDTATGWTHMRVFALRDSAQWRALSARLDSATIQLTPDSAARRRRGEYAVGLRDRVGAVTVELLGSAR